MNQKSKKENNQKERQKTGGQGVGLVGGVGGWAEREWDWKSANQRAEDQKVSLPAVHRAGFTAHRKPRFVSFKACFSTSALRLMQKSTRTHKPFIPHEQQQNFLP